MADNTFRMTRRDAAAPSGQQSDDPLAELARLIGRNPPAGNAPAQHHEQPLDVQQSDPQWAPDARYAEQQYDQPQYDERQSQYGEGQHSGDQYNEGQYREGQYNDNQYDDRHDAPRLADPYPPAYGAAPQSYNAGYEQPDQYAAPPQQHDTRGYSDQPQRYDARGYSDQPQQYDTRGYSDQPQYDDAHDPVQEVPAFLPRIRGERRDDRYDYAQDQGQGRGQAYDQNGYDQDDYERGYAQPQEGDPDDRGYALEDYEDDDEAPVPRRRGFAIAAALVGVIILGTAGWFAYGAMFGGSGLPSLPPIIRADNTPNKIIPANNSANASGQASANSGSPDKLVSREEKPVDVPAPGNAPRVVSTVPVFPDPNASMMPGGGQNMAGQNMPGAVASGGAPGGSLGPTAAGSAYGSSAAPAAQMPAMAPQNVPPLQSPPVAGAGNAKKIHTVAIHNGQMDNSDAAAAAPAHAPAARPAAPSRPVGAAPQGGNAPMSIMPSPGGAAPDAAPPARTALARPQATEPAPSAAPTASGYFVQVSSQRSEADAQTAYHGLQDKFPSQLGGHEATIRQVDLGEKGIYFRTLVGPYGSMEQAAQMCSSLKAAGGSCLVQRN